MLYKILYINITREKLSTAFKDQCNTLNENYIYKNFNLYSKVYRLSPYGFTFTLEIQTSEPAKS